jgi:hypothetical protein
MGRLQGKRLLPRADLRVDPRGHVELALAH